MNREEEMKALVKTLESIFTIDESGRSEKAKRLLHLFDNYDKKLILEEIKKISERSFM